MTKRQERLRKALENGPDAMGPDEPGWAVDAVYNVPDAGVSLRGRQAIEDMIKVLDKHLDVRVVSMEEHNPFITVHAEVENRMPGMEYKGPVAMVVKANDRDEVLEFWSFRA
jgi:hypothetical protein